MASERRLAPPQPLDVPEPGELPNETEEQPKQRSGISALADEVKEKGLRGFKAVVKYVPRISMLDAQNEYATSCLLYTSPSPRD